jgi:hypothetical protein
MTILDTATGDATGLSEADERIMAREAWHADPSLTGRELADRYGRPAKWGQRRRAEAMAEAAARTHPSADTPATVTKLSVARVPDTPRTTTPRKPRTASANTRTLLAVTYVSVGTVLAVAAVTSYVHIRHLSERAGMGVLAGWLPLALDGMVIACTGFLMSEGKRRTVDIWIARAGLVIGLATSLTANAVAVDPELVPIRTVRLVLAVYPPIAVLVSGHLALRMRGDR